MGITVFITLRVTRLVLVALCTADFEIFNYVGVVIAMLIFLNAASTFIRRAGSFTIDPREKCLAQL